MTIPIDPKKISLSMLELVVSRGGRDVIALPIEGKALHIGRAGTNDLSLPDPTVSRHQCQILLKDNSITLQDKSGKGTQVDGKRCTETELHPGSRIELGSLTY